MKKVLRVVLVLVVILVLAVIAAVFYMGAIVERSVETVGPRVTQVDVQLDAANVSMLTGNGSLKGLMVGNPKGYDAPSAIKAEEISVGIQPGSVFADKLVVRSVKIVSPEITLVGLGGDNLRKIMDNVQSATGGPSGPKEDEGAARKLQVDDLLITNGMVNVVLPGVGSAKVGLPVIHLTDMGKGAEGITPAELSAKVLDAVLQQATAVARDPAKAATEALTKEANRQLEKVTKGIGDFLKK